MARRNSVAEFTRIACDNLGFTGGAGGLFIPYEVGRDGEWWNLRGGQLLFYYVALALATIAVLVTALLARSRLGYQWLAVREDQEAARAIGIDVFQAKMLAVVTSAAMTAVGGVFYAFYYGNLFPAQVFDIGRSIELILAPIIGGLGTVFGPVVGAFLIIAMQNWRRLRRGVPLLLRIQPPPPQESGRGTGVFFADFRPRITRGERSLYRRGLS